MTGSDGGLIGSLVMGVGILLAFALTFRILIDLVERKKEIMAAIDDLLSQVTTQLDKAKGEILDKISDLEAEISAGAAPSQETLDALRAAAQALDDVVPDAPPVEEPPVEEPPVEEPPVEEPPTEG